ncbi:MerR family transcriptional regulator [Actinobacteria bacterium YIM 96077]|uniref:MerR family transcriptional regulator n=1 Tax=Phytoactinopolyspora halophila TaxID=1981511 RepID=A0A329QD33_9ACTN|nr:MerR family transcriptional regulator [Phytoactinopolyspora halophila]AYY14019.1 MerR family transcriptional regulator [Actinobacteria bacterium YIM 96077]RAW10270.1 MerR family transcriptional regulator [Phytoactinopolyspora halophila]
MTQYSPAQVAEKTGFSIDTLRYYERIGLLHHVTRTTGGRRIFTDDDLGWLGLVRCLRDTGMPIADMLRFAELCRAGDDTVPARLELLEQHDAAVQEKIAHLRAQQRRIRDKIQWYRNTEGCQVDRSAPADRSDSAEAVSR